MRSNCAPSLSQLSTDARVYNVPANSVEGTTGLGTQDPVATQIDKHGPAAGYLGSKETKFVGGVTPDSRGCGAPMKHSLKTQLGISSVQKFT
jgi:hypothetical protein